MANVNEFEEKIAILNKGKRAFFALAWIDEARSIRLANPAAKPVHIAVQGGIVSKDGNAANYYLGACLDIRLDSILEEMRSLAQLDIDNAERC